MSTATVTIIVAVVGVIGAIVGSAVSAWLNRDKDDADTATKISAAWSPVFERQDQQIEDLKSECKDCRIALGLVRKDFGAFTDVMEDLLNELGSLMPAESLRRGRVAISAARQSHLNHNSGQ